MPLSVRLDAKTEALIGRLARKRRQTKSEVIRDAIGVLANQEENGAAKKRPYDLVAHLIGCVKGGPADLSVRTGEKFYQMLVRPKKKRR
ncbi:MAG: ribbon-helix-helix protein, CopG family [Candidatus Binatia bacterium]